MLYGSLAGGFGLLAVVFLSVCIAKRNRQSYRSGPLRPQTAVALKYANVKGPGGLKNSPSSLPSPLSSDSSQSSPVVPVRPSLPSPQTLRRVQPSQLGPHRGYINFTLRYNIISSALQVSCFHEFAFQLKVYVDKAVNQKAWNMPLSSSIPVVLRAAPRETHCLVDRYFSLRCVDAICFLLFAVFFQNDRFHIRNMEAVARYYSCTILKQQSRAGLKPWHWIRGMEEGGRQQKSEDVLFHKVIVV